MRAEALLVLELLSAGGTLEVGEDFDVDALAFFRLPADLHVTPEVGGVGEAAPATRAGERRLARVFPFVRFPRGRVRV